MNPTIEEKHMMGAYFYLAASSLLLMLKVIGAIKDEDERLRVFIDRLAQGYLNRMIEEANQAGCSNEDWTRINKEMMDMDVSLKADR